MYSSAQLRLAARAMMKDKKADEKKKIAEVKAMLKDKVWRDMNMIYRSLYK